MVTSKEARLDALRGLDAGADAYLKKPVDADELIRTLLGLLSRAEQLPRHGSRREAPCRRVIGDQLPPNFRAVCSPNGGLLEAKTMLRSRALSGPQVPPDETGLSPASRKPR